MNQLIKILFLTVLLFTLTIAGELRQSLVAPKGLDTTTDPVDLNAEYATILHNLTRYAPNEDLQGRKGLYHKNAFDMKDGFGKRARWIMPYSGYYTMNKMLVGIFNDSAENAYDTSHGSHAAWSGTSLADTIQGYVELAFSQGTNYPNKTIEHTKLFGRSHYNYTYFKNQLIICDDRSIPFSFVDISIDLKDEVTKNFWQRSEYSSGLYETESYGSLLPIGLEKPGELRVQLFDLPSGTNTFDDDVYFRYSYCYIRASNGAATGYNTMWSPLSRPVFPSSSQYVLLSGFESSPVNDWDRSADTILIDRIAYSKKDQGSFISSLFHHSGASYALDSFFVIWDTGHYYFTDTGLTRTIHGTLIDATGYDSAYGPGTFNTGHMSRSDKASLKSGWSPSVCTLQTSENYWFAYSYYDPIRGIESELGNYYKLTPLAFATSGDSIPTLVKQMSRSRNTAPHIRIYRSKANDSTFMYGMWEMGANILNNKNCNIWNYVNYNSYWNYPGGQTDSSFSRAFIPYFYTDDQIATGDLASVYSNYEYNEQYDYQVMERFYTEDGVTLVRPPFERGCHYQFSDVAVLGSRLYGIGDPEFPERVFYSDFDSLDNWSAFNYWDLSDGSSDYIVAIEKIEIQGQDVLVCFKQTSIYLLYGDDPEFSFKSTKLKINTGLINERSYVVINGAVYFLGTDYNVYTIPDLQQALIISAPISASIDTFYTIYNKSPLVTGIDTSAFMTKVTDHILLGNTDTSLYYAFNYKMNTWHQFQYGIRDGANYSWLTPRYSFYYDTSSSDAGFSAPTYTLYDVENKLMFERLTLQTDATTDDGADSVGYSIKEYQSKCWGDGEWRYSIGELDLDFLIDLDVARTGSDSDFIRIIIKDAYGNLIDTSDYCFNSTEDTRQRIKFGFKGREAECIAFNITTYRQLTAGGIDSVKVNPSEFIIYSVEPHIKRAGRIKPQND